jgi:hypothetical protein
MLDCGLLISSRGAGWRRSGTAVAVGRGVTDAGRGVFSSGDGWGTPRQQVGQAASVGKPRAGTA